MITFSGFDLAEMLQRGFTAPRQILPSFTCPVFFGYCPGLLVLILPVDALFLRMYQIVYWATDVFIIRMIGLLNLYRHPCGCSIEQLPKTGSALENLLQTFYLLKLSLL